MIPISTEFAIREGQQRKDGKYETHRLRKTSTLLRTKRVSQKVSSSGYSQGTPGEAMGSTSFAYTEIQSYSVTRLYTVKDGKHETHNTPRTDAKTRTSNPHTPTSRSMGVVGGVLGGRDTGFFVNTLPHREDRIMRYGLPKKGWLRSEKSGLHIHQLIHDYKKYITLEQCAEAYRKYWEFVAAEMNGPRLF